MNCKLQLAIILLVTGLITAIGSHAVIALTRIETKAGRAWEIGPTTGHPAAYLAGSSLSGDGIAWDRVADELRERIGGWGVAGSSPWEWEAFQGMAARSKLTFVVVSPYDLNESYLCDFHANVVPAGRTIRDLWEARCDWHFWKRVLSQYPLKCVRTAFPTAGRSRGVMGQLNEKLRLALGGSVGAESESGPTLAYGKGTASVDYKDDKLSNWSQGKVLRRLSALRGAAQGSHEFNGPKKLALTRMLKQGVKQGKVVAVVLPVSAAYTREFVTTSVADKFQATLEDVRRSAPGVHWVRLDQCSRLNSNDLFWDVVHMNREGQRIATEALMQEISRMHLSSSPQLNSSQP